MTDLASKRCVPCEGGVPPLDAAAREKLMASLKPHWKPVRDGQALEAHFDFKNYYHTQAFVNAVAWIAHREDHHPDIRFAYNSCDVEYSTHAVKGLTENDFICAAKIDALAD